MKTVLVTGATGAIASRLIPELLKDEDVRLKLLIHAVLKEEAESKSRAVLEFWDVDTDDVGVMGRIEAIPGDITQERLGLPDEKYNALTAAVTHIIHCATNIKLMLPIDEARRSTLEGTKNVARFAEKCTANGQFKRFGYLSTMEVAGGMRGIVPERFITERRRFLNTYETAKAETEDFLRTMSERGLPLTIYRPSMVVGDSRTGKAIKFQSFYHLVEDMFISPALPIMPCRLDWKLDIVPVDFVAKVIVSTYDARSDANARVYNITAGPENAVSLSQLRDELKLTLEKLMGRKLKVPCALSPRVFYAALHILRLLSFGAARNKINYQLIIIKFMFLDQIFENRTMRAEIEKKGLTVPKVPDFLSTICGYYLRNRANDEKNGNKR